MAEDWSSTEVEAIIADYFRMLEQELRGESYSKTNHRRELSKLLRGRSDGSIERKHQNISAALLALGFPYINGYKPLRNYQRVLFEAVDAHVSRRPNVESIVAVQVDEPAYLPPVQNVLSILEEPPGSRSRTARQRPSGYQVVPSRRIDYLAREARNSSLGAAGEKLVIEFETARLRRGHNPKLADRIERVSETKGDSVGFDILSFEESGRERLIEVKTTSYAKETPFYFTRNELSCSRDKPEEYFLYRLFQFRSTPRLYFRSGALDKSFRIEPVEFLARVA